MTIDDLAHEAEVEAEVLRSVSGFPPNKAERFLIALAFKIKQATPKVEAVETRTRAPAGTLGELSRRIIDFLTRAGGTSTMGGIKDACATTKWSRNRIGTEVWNLVRDGLVVRDDERKDAIFYTLIKSSQIAIPQLFMPPAVEAK